MTSQSYIPPDRPAFMCGVKGVLGGLNLKILMHVDVYSAAFNVLQVEYFVSS